jgi:outer membrane lipoprotein SlyB
MKKLAAMVGAVALVCLLLPGCAANGALSANAASDVQTALGVGCPVVTVIQSSNLKLNAYQKSALSTLALACPPNPTPTSAAVVVADLIAAYATLQPLIK